MIFPIAFRSSYSTSSTWDTAHSRSAAIYAGTNKWPHLCTNSLSGSNGGKYAKSNDYNVLPLVEPLTNPYFYLEDS